MARITELNANELCVIAIASVLACFSWESSCVGPLALPCLFVIATSCGAGKQLVKAKRRIPVHPNNSGLWPASLMSEWSRAGKA